MILSRNPNGYAITSRNYFSDLVRSHHRRVHHRYVRQANIDWRTFEFLLDEVNRTHTSPPWHRHRVFAFDGSYIDSPRCKESLEEFGTLYGSHRSVALSGIATNAFFKLATGGLFFIARERTARNSSLAVRAFLKSGRRSGLVQLTSETGQTIIVRLNFDRALTKTAFRKADIR
jgi:hypothetical protein